MCKGVSAADAHEVLGGFVGKMFLFSMGLVVGFQAFLLEKLEKACLVAQGRGGQRAGAAAGLLLPMHCCASAQGLGHLVDTNHQKSCF